MARNWGWLREACLTAFQALIITAFVFVPISVAGLGLVRNFFDDFVAFISLSNDPSPVWLNWALLLGCLPFIWALGTKLGEPIVDAIYGCLDAENERQALAGFFGGLIKAQRDEALRNRGRWEALLASIRARRRERLNRPPDNALE